MKSLYQKITLFAAIAIFIPWSSYSQCAMCRAALMTGDNKGVAEGINHGITYLMAFPYVLAGIMGVAIYFVIKKEVKAK